VCCRLLVMDPHVWGKTAQPHLMPFTPRNSPDAPQIRSKVPITHTTTTFTAQGRGDYSGIASVASGVACGRCTLINAVNSRRCNACNATLTQTTTQQTGERKVGRRKLAQAGADGNRWVHWVPFAEFICDILTGKDWMILFVNTPSTPPGTSSTASRQVPPADRSPNRSNQNSNT
jgi:hypothetical protein